MRIISAFVTGIGFTLLAATMVRAQPAPAAAGEAWTVSEDGKSMTVKATCTTAELEAACKAKGAQLTAIDFEYGNKSIDGLAPLAQAKGLKSMHTMGMELSQKTPFDLAPLAGLTELEDLDLYNTHVKNTQALAGLKKLKKLSFYMCDVDSIDCVKGMADLVELKLYGFGHTFKDYTPLLGLTKLKTLDIYMNKQATDELLAPLAALTSLESIQMDNDSKVTTLGFLKGSKGMKTIDAMWCSGLTDISALKDMDQLESLSISGVKISDITLLAGKAHLTDLDISDSLVADLSPLEKCVALNRLNIAKTPVKDLTPLANCKKLSGLTVSATVPQEQIDKLKAALPKLNVEVRKD